MTTPSVQYRLARARLCALAAVVDALDLHVYGGVTLASFGLAFIDWRLALIFAGSAVAYIGITAPGAK